MKRFLVGLILAIVYSCAPVEKNPFVWVGKTDISAAGGSSDWRPSSDNVRIIPTINAIFVSLYDGEGNRTYFEEIQDPGKTVNDNWYEVLSDSNLIRITFMPNTTHYMRMVEVVFDDGTPGGRKIGVKQSPSGDN